jgi:hypothetical protein
MASGGMVLTGQYSHGYLLRFSMDRELVLFWTKMCIRVVDLDGAIVWGGRKVCSCCRGFIESDCALPWTFDRWLVGGFGRYTVEQVMCLVHSWELRDAFLDQEC